MNKEILKSVLIDYQIEVPKHIVTPRYFEFDSFSNYVFVGIRRAGKSYLLYQIIQQFLSTGKDWSDILYINFEDERLDSMTSQDLNLLLEIHLEMYGKRPILFLDEIQNISGWEKFARRLADLKYKVYITGSNAKMLSNEIATTLGGRYIQVEVYPYSFQEYLSAKQVHLLPTTFYSTEQRAALCKHFNEYFHYGGFPEGIFLNSKRDYLLSIYQKIFLSDIATRYSIDNYFALKLLIKKIAESINQPISFTRLANIVSSSGVKISKATIINYINYAKEAWLLTSITNIAGKILDKETKPKYYFTDNGILNLFILDSYSSLLENIVAINLIRKYGRSDSVYFYNHNTEVDFYVPEDELAIQVCYSLYDSDTFNRETKALISLSSVVSCKRLVVITKDEEQILTIGNNTIEVIPIWKWLL